MNAVTKKYRIRIGGYSKRGDGAPIHKGYELSVPGAIVRALGGEAEARKHEFVPELTDEGILYRPVKSERGAPDG
jgi:hypothetical protein